MSTYYGYYCKTCDDTSPTNLKSAYEDLTWLYKNRDLIIKLFRLDMDTLCFNCFFEFSNEEYLKFLHEHKNHVIYIYDEYNYVYKIDADVKDYLGHSARIGDLKEFRKK